MTRDARATKQEEQVMGLMCQFTSYLQDVFSSALEALEDSSEDPGPTLEQSYHKQLEQLQNLRRAVADMVTIEKRLELQQAHIESQIAKYENQERQAMAANREDLARIVLERRQQLQGRLTGYQRQIEDAKERAASAIQLEQHLSSQVERFRAEKEILKARADIASVQAKINEAAANLFAHMGE
ncbi:MAG TPA: PspA/IM30 family protein [Ktedonobacterales bacterium]|nr:PspA/IM30 family protein [Ktedonobacterales bacterium]